MKRSGVLLNYLLDTVCVPFHTGDIPMDLHQILPALLLILYIHYPPGVHTYYFFKGRRKIHTNTGNRVSEGYTRTTALMNNWGRYYYPTKRVILGFSGKSMGLLAIRWWAPYCPILENRRYLMEQCWVTNSENDGIDKTFFASWEFIEVWDMPTLGGIWRFVHNIIPVRHLLSYILYILPYSVLSVVACTVRPYSLQ